jgi:signal transduction histidine kinase
MATGRVSSSEADLYRRKEWITTLARVVSCALALGALVVLWNSPRTRSLPAALTGVAWITFFFVARYLRRRFPGRSHQHRLHDANRRLQGTNVELLDTAARARDMEAEARAHLARAREANARLEQLDRLRKQYLGNVSHEFRTPLTVIRGYGEHLMSEGRTPEGSISDVMRVIVESCDQVIDMVDTVIEVSRIEEEGARSLSLESVDLRTEGPFGALDVQDTGVGIAPEHIPRIFDEFYMADGSFTRRRRGAGVGLYLAREIVRLHHGTIEVESQPGEGSVFLVRLPGPLVAGPIPDARV